MPPATHQPYILFNKIQKSYGGRNELNPPTILETL